MTAHSSPLHIFSSPDRRLLISAFWLHRNGGLSVHLPLRFLGTHLGTRLGALGLLRQD
jgi:hypothetical protein